MLVVSNSRPVSKPSSYHQLIFTDTMLNTDYLLNCLLLWKFDEVLTVTKMHSFFETRSISTNQVLPSRHICSAQHLTIIFLPWRWHCNAQLVDIKSVWLGTIMSMMWCDVKPLWTSLSLSVGTRSLCRDESMWHFFLSTQRLLLAVNIRNRAVKNKNKGKYRTQTK